MSGGQVKDEFGEGDVNLFDESSILQAIAGLVTDPFDYVSVDTKNINGDPTQITYKTGGASGTTVAVLTVTYDTDGDLKTITKS